MAAPMVPKHHIRQEVSDTRPAYREGRQAKAVKVYTVNQESRYLLVQGVPAVGGCQELVKLFAVYGAIEEYRALDDYPAEEFTEVYWFKFKKIQSARYAKRKLDDYSFFGGVLHVCYAPEYETVEETREKLQDRRRIIAAKLRQQGQTGRKPEERLVDETTSSESSVISHGQHDNTSPSTSFTLDASIQQRLTSSHSDPVIPSSTTSSCSSNSHFHEKVPSCSNERTSKSDGVHSSEDLVSRGENSQICQSRGENSKNNESRVDNSESQVNLYLPPPPVNTGLPRFSHPKSRKYDYAWVPSSHSTLPSNYDGRIQSSEQTATSHELENSQTENLKSSSTELDRIGSKIQVKPTEKIVNGVVIREFKKVGTAPKFVPRQVQEKKGSDTKEGTSRDNDVLNKEIRVNAFTLGDVQGPVAPDRGKTSVKVQPGVQKAMDQTVKDIRKRITKFISEKIPAPKKSKPS